MSRLSFLEYINEAKQVGILYHYTTLVNLEKLISDNFKFTSNNGYISTSRNFYLSDKDYGHITNKRGYVVRIALDSNKMSEHFKIVPVLGMKDDIPDVLNINKNLEKHRVSRRYEENEELIMRNIKGYHFNNFILAIDFSDYNKVEDENQLNVLQNKLKDLNIKTIINSKWAKR